MLSDGLLAAASTFVQPTPSTGPFVYAGDVNGLNRLNPTTGAQDTTGSWPSDVFPFAPRNIAYDPINDRIYVSSGDLWRINQDGTSAWSFAFDTNADSLAVDTNGFIYATKSSQFDDTRVFKINPDGTENTSDSWPFVRSGNANTTHLAIDPSGNIFFYNNVSPVNAFIRKLNPDGTENTADSWPNNSIPQGVSARALITDLNGDLYFANDAAGSGVQKINANGTIAWTFDTTAGLGGSDPRPWAIAFDPISNALYVATRSGILGKINPDGTQNTSDSWPYTQAAEIRSLTIMEDGSIYIGGTDDVVRKINSDGTEDTSGSWPVTLGGTIFSLGNTSGLYPVFWTGV